MTEQQNCCCSCQIHLQENWIDPAIDKMWYYKSGAWSGVNYLSKVPIEAHLEDETLVENGTVSLYDFLQCDGSGLVYLRKPNPKTLGSTYLHISGYFTGDAIILTSYNPDTDTGEGIRVFGGTVTCSPLTGTLAIKFEVGHWDAGWTADEPPFFPNESDLETYNPNGLNSFDISLWAEKKHFIIRSNSGIEWEWTWQWYDTNAADSGNFIAVATGGSLVQLSLVDWQIEGDQKPGCPTVMPCVLCGNPLIDTFDLPHKILVSLDYNYVPCPHSAYWRIVSPIYYHYEFVLTWLGGNWISLDSNGCRTSSAWLGKKLPQVCQVSEPPPESLLLEVPNDSIYDGVAAPFNAEGIYVRVMCNGTLFFSVRQYIKGFLNFTAHETAPLLYPDYCTDSPFMLVYNNPATYGPVIVKAYQPYEHCTPSSPQGIWSNDYPCTVSNFATITITKASL